MRKSVGRALGAAALAVVAVPGVAFASGSEVAADPQPSVEEPAPPSWAPEECQEIWDSPQMQEWRADHQSEMKAMHEQGGGMHRGPRAGHMWDGE